MTSWAGVIALDEVQADSVSVLTYEQRPLLHLPNPLPSGPHEPGQKVVVRYTGQQCRMLSARLSYLSIQDCLMVAGAVVCELQFHS